jgi:hypothetical protein
MIALLTSQRAAQAGERLRAANLWTEAAEFHASAGFLPVGKTQTLFGPAPRLRLDVRSSE